MPHLNTKSLERSRYGKKFIATEVKIKIYNARN